MCVTLTRIAPLTLVLAVSGCAGIRPSALCRNDVIHARQMSQQGLDAVHRGHFDQAEFCFLDAIDHSPTNSTARYQLANCLWKRGARHEAIAQLTEALQLSSGDDIEMLVELGYMHANVGNLNQAVKIAEHALSRDPHNPAVWKLHGDGLNELGRDREALVSFQRALAYDPDDARVLVATAEIYSQLGRSNRALSSANHAEEIIPDEHIPESLYVLKSLALQELERHDEAVEVLVSLRRRRPLQPAGAIRLAEAQAAIGKLADADRTIADALANAARPEDRDALEGLRIRIADVRSRRKDPLVR